MSGYTSATLLAVSIAGTAMTAMGTIAQGNAAKSQGQAAQMAADFEAKQREVVAGQERAAAQRNYLTEKKQADLVSSRALAVSAASGGGVMDPTVVNLLGDIESEGHYRALMELYGGEERARGQEHAAATRRYEGDMAYAAGKAAQKNSRFQAAGQMLSGIASAGYMGSKMGMFGAAPKTVASTAGSGTSMFQKYGYVGGGAGW